jgi:hypothetical protein
MTSHPSNWSSNLEDTLGQGERTKLVADGTYYGETKEGHSRVVYAIVCTNWRITIIYRCKTRLWRLNISPYNYKHLMLTLGGTYVKICFKHIHRPCLMSTRHMNSKTRLKAYRETYLEFKHESPFLTLEDNFNISNFN